VFFRAGALAGLEEAQDDIVIKLVRYMQGEVLKRVRSVVYEKKRDQRELIKVAQRNFRKYMAMREWGWFVIIQKTRPLIGMPNPQEELAMLEEAANKVWGRYDEQIQTKAKLLEENVAIEEEKKALLKQLESEQGNLSVYHEKQAKASAGIADLEGQLNNSQDTLAQREQARQDAMGEKKASGTRGCFC